MRHHSMSWYVSKAKTEERSQISWGTSATAVPSHSKGLVSDMGSSTFGRLDTELKVKGYCTLLPALKTSLSPWLTHYFCLGFSGSDSRRKPKNPTQTSAPCTGNRNPTLSQVRTWKLAEDPDQSLGVIQFPTRALVKGSWAFCVPLAQGSAKALPYTHAWIALQ